MSLQRPTIQLNAASVGTLDRAVRVPAYDRRAVQQHTVHLGVGGFHRAHQAVYLDDLLALEGTERWGECGLGVLAGDARMRDILRRQNYLYTVVERGQGVPSARVIGSLVEYVHAPEAREAALEKMAAPDTRIVSMTITEGGYFLHEATGAFLADHPDIRHDVESSTEPVTSIGLIVEALDRRRQRGLPPFTVMSCDNLQENGHVARRIVLAFAALVNSSLERWIADHVAFPSSMVDRITPATLPADIAFVAETFGIDDGWPVVTEPFKQWVVEDVFSNGRPQWERVGVQLIGDVAPYELMKIRLLNGSHLAMAYLAALHGFTYVHEVMADPLFRRFIASFMEEVTPVVPAIAGTSIEEYKATLLERFSNPTLNDQVTRICSEGSAKIPKWLLPSITELLGKGASIPLLSLVVASWIFYLGRGLNERGETLDILDARAAELCDVARTGGGDPRPMLSVQSIFGDALLQNANFVEEVERALTRISSLGVAETLRQSLERSAAV